MRRRTCFFALLGTALTHPAWAQTADRPERPAGHFIPARVLQEALAQRFPRRYTVGGWLDLTLRSPQLQLLPARNRMGTAIEVLASGPALNRPHTGSLALDFALRFEPSDRSLRAHQLQLGRLDFPSLQPRVVELLNTYGPDLAAQSLNEAVLHQFSAEDLASLTRLGLQPGPITVLDDGLVVSLVARPL